MNSGRRMMGAAPKITPAGKRRRRRAVLASSGRLPLPRRLGGGRPRRMPMGPSSAAATSPRARSAYRARCHERRGATSWGWAVRLQLASGLKH